MLCLLSLRCFINLINLILWRFYLTQLVRELRAIPANCEGFCPCSGEETSLGHLWGGGARIRAAFLLPRGETTAPLIDDDEEAGLPEARATPRPVVVRSVSAPARRSRRSSFRASTSSARRGAASGSSRDLTLRSGEIDATTSEGTPI